MSALLAFREAGPVLYPAHYAGVASGTAESADVLVVFLADSSPALEAEVLAAVGLPASKVRFEAAYQSRAEAQRVHDAITRDFADLRARGLNVVTHGIDEDGVEAIGLAGATDEEIAHLFDTYGPYLRIDRTAGEPTLL
ncbi:hypothetical protein ACEXQD_06225 [Herbiconiux sp. P15]|uniref:hypothetical protein n=1 Tax=Herbiconiux liukaitaii TaxID=3342799 RepID=UPI0035BA416C